MSPTMNLLKNALGDFFNVSILSLLIVTGFLPFSSFIKRIKERSLFSRILFSSCIVIYLFGLYHLKIPEERIHLIEYGLLSVLVFKALEFDLRKKGVLYVLSFFIVVIIGSVDEFIQYILPNRVGDLKDVFLNAFSGLLGLVVLFSFREKGCPERGNAHP